MAGELLKLMRKKKKDHIDIAAFPGVVGASRVRSEANRLGINLSDGEGIRVALCSILDDLQDQENAAKAAHQEAGIEHEMDQPLAMPAMQLLGLTPTTENKGIGARQRIAAKSRRVQPRTMRAHERIIATELAVCLTSVPTVENYRELVVDDSAASKLAELRQRRVPVIYSLGDLAKEDLRALVEALAATYDEFNEELFLLWHDIAMLDWKLAEFEQVKKCKALRALANGDFDTGSEFSLPMQLYEPVLTAERPPFDSKYCWLIRTLDIVDGNLFAVSERDAELLRYAVAEDNCNIHRFISLLEETPVGEELLENWERWLSEEPTSAGGLGADFMCVLGGLVNVKTLMGGKEPDEDVIFYVKEHEPEPRKKWVLEHS